MADRIQLRRDTAANWTNYNPILLEGEPGIELDTDQWKLGDGIHNWNNLPYRGGPYVQQKGQSTTVAMSQKAVTDAFTETHLDISKTLYGYSSEFQNKKINVDGTVSDNQGTYITDYIPLGQTAAVLWKHGLLPVACYLCVYDTNKDFINYYNNGGSDLERTLNIPAYAYIRATFNAEFTDACLVNVTANKDLYRWTTQTKDVINAIKKDVDDIKQNEPVNYTNQGKTQAKQLSARNNINALTATRLIFGSKTNQLLDVNKIVRGLYINASGVGSFVENEKGIISQPIYVGHLSRSTKLTFSPITGVTEYAVTYLWKAELKNESIVRSINVGSSGRTDTISNNSIKYLVVTLQKSTDIDYSAAKVSIGETETTDVYEEKYLGVAGDEDNFLLPETVDSLLTDKEMSPLIFGSKTNQLLDLTSIVEGFIASAFSSGSITKTNDKRYAISKPIYVGHLKGKSITFSYPTTGGSVSVSYISVLFMSKYGISNDYITNSYFIENGQRTLTVPNSALYLIVGIKSSAGYDPTGMKVSIGSEITTDDYLPKYLGVAGDEDNWVISDKVNSLVFNEQMSPLIFGSKTKQLLDINAIVNGYYMSGNGVGSFVENPKGIISKPIYVGHLKGGDITVSGYQSNWNIAIVFLSAFGIDDSLCVTAKNGTNTSRTIVVPSNALYVVLTLQNPTSSAYPFDYSSIKISVGDTETTDVYEGEILGYAGKEDDFYKEPLATTYYEHVLINERFEVEKRLAPYSIGTPTDTFVWDTHHDRLNIAFMTDSHVQVSRESMNNVRDAVAFLNDTKCPIDLFMHGGDFWDTAGLVTKEQARVITDAYFNAIKELNGNVPFIQTIGNHDPNDWNNTPANAFTDEDWDNFIFNWQRTNFGTVHKTDGSYAGKTYQSPYCYLDIDKFKVRIISINQMDLPHGDAYVGSTGRCLYWGSGAFYIQQEQFDWFINTALDFSDKDEKDWGVILLGHANEQRGVRRFPDGNYQTAETVVPIEDSALDKVLKVLEALNTQSTYSNIYTCALEPKFNLNISADFTQYANAEKKPYVIAFICGHDHYDKNYVAHGINVIQTIDSVSEIYSTDGRINRIAGTPTQNAFDIFSIDTFTKKIYVTRFGAAENCFGDNGNGDRFKPNGLSY